MYIRRWRPEIFVGWASAWLGPSRVDLGPAWSNLNGGIGLRLNRWFGVEFEVGHSVDEALREVPPPVSSGAGAAQLRQGVTSATFASSKALFYLPTTRVQPYFGVGIGMVWEEGVAPTHCEGNNPPTCDFRAPPVGEAPYKNDQVGRALSVGVRLALTPRVFVRTEFAGYAGVIQKASVTGAYQF
jgi:hypothetical protein